MGSCMRLSTLRRQWISAAWVPFVAAMATAPAAVMGANFETVSYDSGGDQLIVTMTYEGTNPNHHFSIQWGPCRKHIDQLNEPPRNIVEVGILDDQGSDAAENSYTKVVKVSLAGLSCRPATVTLWTPPHFTASIDIP